MAEQVLIYFPFGLFAIVTLFLFGRHIFNSFTDDKTEKQLASDKRKSDQLAAAAHRIEDGVEKCKGKSEQIETNQQRIAERIDDAARAITEAGSRSEETVRLVDECLDILKEAERKSR